MSRFATFLTLIICKHLNAIKFHFHLNSFIVNVYNLALALNKNTREREANDKKGTLRLKLITMQQVTQFNLEIELNLNAFNFVRGSIARHLIFFL